jgi:predicted nucleic acid-binding protein
VILVDANILIYANNEAASHHAQARDWLGDRLNGTTRVGLPWAVLLALLRIATNIRVFPRPLTIALVWGKSRLGSLVNRCGPRSRRSATPKCLAACWSCQESTATSLPTHIWPLWQWSTG